MTGGLPRVPIPIPTTAASEPDQGRDRQTDRETADEVAGEPQRQVRLEEKDHRRHLADPPAGCRGTSWVTIAIANNATTDANTSTRSRWTGRGSAQVVDQDHDEDQDERRLQSDIDGVHESLGSAPRVAGTASVAPFSQAQSLYRGR